jgi:hypothetical protein
MESSIAELIGTVGISTAVVIAVFWYIFTRWFDGKQEEQLRRLNVQLDRFSAIDQDLRKKREETYAEIWKASGALPQWPRVEVTSGELYDLSSQLKKWYFEKGGIYLSDEARKKYTPVQERINSYAQEDGQEVFSGESQAYEEIRKAFSDLRTELTRDLQSRVRHLVQP